MRKQFCQVPCETGSVATIRKRVSNNSYWDYYRQRFERDRGLKIDFVLATPSLASRVTGAFIDREERAGQGASDHAPVVVDLAD
jgi:exodeoxyribonuclease III